MPPTTPPPGGCSIRLTNPGGTTTAILDTTDPERIEQETQMLLRILSPKLREQTTVSVVPAAAADSTTDVTSSPSPPDPPATPE